MSEITLSVTVKKSDNKLFYHKSVDIPYNTERVNVSYTYSPAACAGGRNEIDIAVACASGDVGTRGSDVKHFTVGPDYSTDGFIRVKPEGTWDIIIGRGKLFSEEIDVEVKLEFIPAKRRYYAGDTHSHTVNSDGKYTYKKLFDMAARKGLEYLIVTDHNRPAIYGLPAKKGLTVIPGVETTIYMGHANIWGADRPYSGTFATDDLEKWRALKEEAKAGGAVVSVNHPFCSKCPWRWELDPDDFDSVEVMTGPPRDDTQKAVDWWKSLVMSGRHITAVGGSDYHKNYVVVNLLGVPTTYVYSASRAGSDILRAIKEGRTSIVTSKKRGFIDVRCGSAVVGDEVPFDGKNEVAVTVKNLKRKDTLVVYDGKGVLYEHTARKSGDLSVKVTPRAKGPVFAEVKSRYRGIMSLAYNVILLFMLPEQAFKKHKDYAFSLCSPIWFV